MSKRIAKIALLTACVATVPFLSASEKRGQPPPYKAETSIELKTSGQILYLGMTSKDELCVLASDGTVSIVMDDKGRQIAAVKPEIKGIPCSLAVDDKDNIYVLLSTEYKRGMPPPDKKNKKSEPASCCIVLKDGTVKKTFQLEQVLSPVAAKIIDGKLVVADNAQSAIFICDAESGKVLKSINKGIRICCGIFDFCEGPDNSILVANLGAFKVSKFTLGGQLKEKESFGSRGNQINDFHGCCNPVSVAWLPKGGILTVEKSPTRVKTFDNNGTNAVPVRGVEELVQGCSHIPIALDSNNNIFLASKNSGKIIKCIPDKE